MNYLTAICVVMTMALAASMLSEPDPRPPFKQVVPPPTITSVQTGPSSHTHTYSNSCQDNTVSCASGTTSANYRPLDR